VSRQTVAAVLDLPLSIEMHVKDKYLVPIHIGHSEAALYQVLAPNVEWYLKIEAKNEAFTREQQLTAWLQKRLPVPKIIASAHQNGKDYLLMTKVPGEMACSESSLQNPQKLVMALADGIKRLQCVEIAHCPFDFSLEAKLALAYERIHTGAVSMADWEPQTPFSTPEALYDYLVANQPDEVPVFTHGDYCLPNIFIQGSRTTGFIDTGRAGIADKWQDIALCTRSLAHNLKTEAYHALFFEALELKPDDAKINYYILLDELF
jgi:kanamycin kinase/aminoglycoside 3'-phosphotransferase-3